MTPVRRICSITLASVFACGCFAVAAQEPVGDRIAGQVVSAVDGHPLAHAAVTLRDTRNERLVASVNAGDDGHYSFESVAAGKYRLTASAHGYFPAAYDEHQGFSTAIVTGKGLATDALTLRLTPLASLSGRVIDDTGDPVEHANVQLYREDPNEGGQIKQYRGASTQSDGSFEFSRLQPGKYYLSANGTPWYAVHPRAEGAGFFQYQSSVDPSVDVAYPLTFYPHALDSSEATPIELHGGEQQTTDMTLSAERAMSLSIRLPAGQRPGVTPPPQLVRTVFGVEQPVNIQQVSFMDGGEQFMGLAPGQYNLRQITPNGMSTGTASIDLTSGSAFVDSPPPVEPSTIAVAIHMANGEALPSHCQLQLWTNQQGSIAGAEANNKGVATLENVVPGTYRFMLNASNRRLEPQRLVVDGHEVKSNELHVSAGSAIKAELTVTTDSVEVEGFAMRDGKPGAGSVIVLVPAGGDHNPQLFRRDQSDLDGSFVFHGVVPGKYILVAIDDGWQVHWNDADSLLPYLIHGVPVVVTANGKASFHIADQVVTQPR